jgi:hypothetical protein
MKFLRRAAGSWKSRRRDPHTLLARFLERYMNRTIIVHEGLDLGWIEELLKQAGGGGHFRIDARQSPGDEPTPVEWLVHQHVLALGLPLPLIIQVREDGIRIRHLRQGQRTVHPSELLWLLDEIGSRYHALLRPVPDGLHVERSIAVDDNRIEGPYGL